MRNEFALLFIQNDLMVESHFSKNDILSCGPLRTVNTDHEREHIADNLYDSRTFQFWEKKNPISDKRQESFIQHFYSEIPNSNEIAAVERNV